MLNWDSVARLYGNNRGSGKITVLTICYPRKLQTPTRLRRTTSCALSGSHFSSVISLIEFSELCHLEVHPGVGLRSPK
jgi:hypothetical protein